MRRELGKRAGLLKRLRRCLGLRATPYVALEIALDRWISTTFQRAFKHVKIRHNVAMQRFGHLHMGLTATYSDTVAKYIHILMETLSRSIASDVLRHNAVGCLV